MHYVVDIFILCGNRHALFSETSEGKPQYFHTGLLKHFNKALTKLYITKLQVYCNK